jgi:hypothetical protein
MFAAPQNLRRQRRRFSRTLRLECLEQRLPLVFDDSLAEAIPLGNIATPQTVNGSISPDVDVDVYQFNVAAGQTVDLDIYTPFNVPCGLGSFLRIFDGLGR